ncbi:MAG: enoyl-CoA hydratase-related protein [Actinomycetota bacterium]
MNTIVFDVDGAGVATLTLNRPERRNAFDEEMLVEINETVSSLPSDVRVLVMRGAGKVFCAGADLGWMMSGAASTSSRLDDMFSTIDTCKVPVVAQVHGAAMAGATGIVACCDIVVAASSTVFAFTEVKIGLIPAVISPYVIRKVGYSFARSAFITAERFDAQRGYEVGLVHRVVDESELDSAVQQVVAGLLTGGPEAMFEARKLVDAVWGKPLGDVRDLTVAAISERRASEEAREGVLAFLEKRKPRWVEGPSS